MGEWIFFKESFDLNFYNTSIYVIAYVGVLATLYSIAKNLTTQIHEQVFKEIILNKWKIIWLIFISFSPFLFLFVDKLFNITVIIKCIFFSSSICFLIFELIIIISLDKQKIYEKLYKKFLNQLKDKNRKNDESINSLELLFLNIEYVAEDNKVLDLEFEWLKKFFEYKENQVNYNLIFSKLDEFLLKSIINNNRNHLTTFFRLLIHNRAVFLKDSPEYQITNLELLYKVILILEKFEEANLYIAETYSFKYFWDEKKNKCDEDWIIDFGHMMNNAIEKEFDICKTILNSDREDKYSLFKRNWSFLIRSMDFYHYYESFDFEENEIKRLKNEIIKNAFNHWRRKNIELILFIMKKIESNSLNKEYFNLCELAVQKKNIGTNLYKYEKGLLNNIVFEEYDSFLGGVQRIEEFNYRKYVMVFLYKEFLEKNELKYVNLLQKEFLEEIKFKIALEEFTEGFIKLYLEVVDNEKFNEFKKRISDYQKDKNEEEKEKRRKEIEEADISKNLKDVQIDIKKVFKSRINEDLKIFQKSIEHKYNSEQHLISETPMGFPKEFFVKEESEKDFFKGIGNDIYNNLFQNIKIGLVNFFNKRIINEIKIHELYIDLKEGLIKDGDYVLFYGNDFHMEVLTLSIPTMKRKSSVRYFEVNKSKIYVIFGNNFPNILCRIDSFSFVFNEKNENEDCSIELKEKIFDDKVELYAKIELDIKYNKEFTNCYKLIKIKGY